MWLVSNKILESHVLSICPTRSSQGTIEARDGMAIRLIVTDTDSTQSELMHETFSVIQTFIKGYSSRHTVSHGQARQAWRASLTSASGVMDEPDTTWFMQQAHSDPPTSVDDSSESSIPDDWYIDLQRRVSQLEHLCNFDQAGEIFFMVQTWYIDHEVGTVSHDMRVAHLGGYPPDWRGDIQFPWRHKIIPDEHVHIDLVFPAMPNLAAQEPIAQLILTQRRSLLVSVLLVVELRYTRPMVFRNVIAIPTQCTCQNIFDSSPLATEYKDSLRWSAPRLYSCRKSFAARDGMAVHLVADFPEQEIEAQELDALNLMQTLRIVEDVPSSQEHCFSPEVGQDARDESHLTNTSSSIPEHIAHGINLPSEDPEPSHYAFNIHAAEYIPGIPPLQAQSEEIQDLYAAWSQLSFSWQSGTIASIEVTTWFVDHRLLYPTCLHSRQVALDAQYYQWEQVLKARWQDQIDQTQPVELVLVRPSPPRMEPNIAAHVILIQSPREEWISSLISVDDPIFNRINDGRLMRLVVTTDEHFTIEQAVQLCGYPVTCTWMHQILRCFAWIQDVQLLPGQMWPGTSGTSVFLSIVRTMPVIVPPGHNGNPHLGLVQTSVQVTRIKHFPHSFQVLSHRESDPEEEDTYSLMAQGRRTHSRHSETPIVESPLIAQQEDVIDEEVESDDSLESSDPDWQEAVIYSPRTEPVTRQINLQSHPLRRYQIAHALRWLTEDVVEDHSLAVGPEAMASHPCHARLVRHRADLPAGSDLVLVLIDTVMHPFPPSWQTQSIRKPMYVFPQLTARQLLQAMFLRNYCTYAELPCIVYHNSIIWHQDADQSRDIYDGDYLIIHIPPPNAPQASLPTRCVAVALHHGYSFEILELLGPFPDYHIQTVPNPYQAMAAQDIQDDDMSSLCQICILRRSYQHTHPSTNQTKLLQIGDLVPTPIEPVPSPKAGPHHLVEGTTRMRTTLGYQNVRPLQNTTNTNGRINRERSVFHRTFPTFPLTWLVQVDGQEDQPYGRTSAWLKSLVCTTTASIFKASAPPKMYVHLQRLGEADVPGPALDSQSQELWAIGSINPTGLAGKAVLFTDLPEGIYGVSETHLTARGKSRFKQELWHAKSKFQITTGADAPYKKSNLRAVGANIQVLDSCHHTHVDL